MKKISKNPEGTKKIAKAFSQKLKPAKIGATVVGLSGELGTGKTTFVQFLAKELKIKRKVNSPTYVIIKKYNFPKQSVFKYLYHIDAYRLNPPAGGEKELLHLGWNEIVSQKEHLIFIEWPENIIKALPKKHHQIHIFHTPKGHRKFEIKKV